MAVAFDIELIRWVPGNVHVSDHDPIAADPVSVSASCAWTPPGHELVTDQATRQDAGTEPTRAGAEDEAGAEDGDGAGPSRICSEFRGCGCG